MLYKDVANAVMIVDELNNTLMDCIKNLDVDLEDLACSLALGIKKGYVCLNSMTDCIELKDQDVKFKLYSSIISHIDNRRDILATHTEVSKFMNCVVRSGSYPYDKPELCIYVDGIDFDVYSADDEFSKLSIVMTCDKDILLNDIHNLEDKIDLLMSSLSCCALKNALLYTSMHATEKVKELVLTSNPKLIYQVYNDVLRTFDGNEVDCCVLSVLLQMPTIYPYLNVLENTLSKGENSRCIHIVHEVIMNKFKQDCNWLKGRVKCIDVKRKLTCEQMKDLEIKMYGNSVIDYERPKLGQLKWIIDGHVIVVGYSKDSWYGCSQTYWLETDYTHYKIIDKLREASM
jgi:hypothetical protein